MVSDMVMLSRSVELNENSTKTKMLGFENAGDYLSNNIQ